MKRVDPFEAGREYARRSRAEQGLPLKVSDPVVLAKLAAILATARKSERAA